MVDTGMDTYRSLLKVVYSTTDHPNALASILQFHNGSLRTPTDNSQFLQLPETAEDVQALWSPNDLRNLTLNTPVDKPPPSTQIAPKKNAETLIYRTVGRLHTLQTKRVFADPNTPIAPEVLNGVRVLTRILP